MQNLFAAFSHRAAPVLIACCVGLLLSSAPALACPGSEAGAACAGGAACPGSAACAKAKEGAAPCPCAAAAAAAESAPKQGHAPGAAGAAPAQQAYVDPATGQLTTPPAGAAVAPSAPVPSRRAEKLEAVPGPGGGGVKADLGEGFRANLTAERGADGKAHVKCDHGAGEHPEHPKNAPAEPAR